MCEYRRPYSACMNTMCITAFSVRTPINVSALADGQVHMFAWPHVRQGTLVYNAIQIKFHLQIQRLWVFFRTRRLTIICYKALTFHIAVNLALPYVIITRVGITWHITSQKADVHQAVRLFKYNFSISV